MGGMTWIVSLIVRPFFAVLLILLAVGLSRLVWRFLPDSRLKRWLFSPLPGHSRRRRTGRLVK